MRVLLPLLLAGCAAADSAASSNSAIIGGVEAEPGAWPGVVAVEADGRFTCGGTLLADQWVLTALHCLRDDSTTGGISDVIIGRHRRSSTEGVVRVVDRAIPHADFAFYHQNDIALLHLSEPAPANATKTRLVAADEDVSGDVVAVGWGRTSSGGSVSDELRQLTLPVIENDTCKALPSYGAIVTPKTLCIGDLTTDRSACNGDSGGPVYLRRGDGDWVEAGIAIWVAECGRRNYPTVYTRVGSYLDWIYAQTDGAARNPG